VAEIFPFPVKRINLLPEAKKPLSNPGIGPIKQLRLMQISSFSISSSSVSPLKASTTPAPAAASASTQESEANFTTSADSFSSLVAQANAMPDVRSELVDSFKARIASGQYPTANTLNDLTDTIGSSILQMAQE
jgi:anti-sigma28 factor (negative regulator of flagellin synthesis)